jgi:hypothetical protein
MRLTARCNDRTLKSGPDIVCTPADPPPACAGTIATDALALAYGDNNPPAAAVDTRALKLHVKCQKRIGKAVNTYVSRKLRTLQKGDDTPEAELRARRLIDKLPDRCALAVAADLSGVVLPSVGLQCAAATGSVGNPVDSAKLADCLATLLDTWVDRIGPDPQPLRPNILFILTDDQRWDSTDGTHSPDGAFMATGAVRVWKRKSTVPRHEVLPFLILSSLLYLFLMALAVVIADLHSALPARFWYSNPAQKATEDYISGRFG